MSGIRDSQLRARWRGKDRWLSNGGARGAGRLVARVGQGGATFLFQYFDPEKRKRFLPIEPYDHAGKRGLTLQQAIDAAAVLSKLYRNGAPDLHAHIARERDVEERARRAAQEAAQRAQDDARRSTLRQLLDAYTAYLERAGKQSAADAAGIFKLHVYDVAPDLAARRAADIPVPEFARLIGRLIEAGKGRTAVKLRSYLRAAFALAVEASTEADAPSTLSTFGVESNPIAAIGTRRLRKYNRARKRKLSDDEMAAFLRRLEAVPHSVKKDALSVCFMLGGQRPAQLLRARPASVDLSGQTLTLLDGKGSRDEPREHIVPLTKKPLAILRRLLEELPDGAPVLFTNDGKRALRPETVSELVTEISAAMVKAKESREPFELRDIRRTCETMLAGLEVSSDVRAMILSHGLGGVQKKHYDFHSYALEMRAALEKWATRLNSLAGGRLANVLPHERRKVS